MKLKIISLILLLSVSLSGCKKQNTESDPAPKQNNNDISYSEPDVSGTNAAYIITDSGWIPFSVCEGGYSMLSGENYYYNLQSTLENSASFNEKQRTVFDDCGENKGNDTSKLSSFTAIATTGNWKLSPSVKKTNYGKNKADGGFSQFILDSFPDKFETLSDIKVKTVWECDVDGDGAGEAVVLSKNQDSTILVFLSQSMGNKILASSFETDKNYVAAPFFADLDGNGSYSLAVVWGDGLKTVTVYKENSLEEDYRVYLPI